MLETLHQIVREVGDAEDPHDALTTIVSGVSNALQVEQCSVYLLDSNTEELVLVATQGLRPESVNRVRLSLGQGLVGAVGSQKHPVRVADASQDPRFVYFPITGEDRFRAFLGVPILHRRQLVGIVSAQTVDHRVFGADDEAFLVTVSAQLAAILHGASSKELLGTKRLDHIGARFNGIPGASGVAVGTPVQPSELADLEQVNDQQDSDPQAEAERFQRAVMEVKAEMVQNADRFRDVLPQEALDLFDVYVELANDPLLLDSVLGRIRGGQWAPAALRDAIHELVRGMEAIEDEKLRARAEDIRGLGRRILLRLQSGSNQITEYPARCVLIGDEISVARIASVPPDQLAGLICFKGSIHSHTAMVARSLNIPAVMGLGPVPVGSFTADTLVVDGYEGYVLVDPPASSLNEFLRLEREEAELAAHVEVEQQAVAETSDHHHIDILANISLGSDLEAARRAGAPGVGLYRSEFPFMIREAFPGEDEQCDIYRGVLDAFTGHPVTMRTLDIGGDKPLPYFPLQDPNPALGSRGIRTCLNHPEILVTQLRAMLRADAGRGQLSIMLPMVSTVAEIVETRSLLEQVYREMVGEGCEVVAPSVGVMIEIPALLYQLERVAAQVDFASIGTNDLTQYLMAADRDNPSVVELYDQLHPCVLTAINQAIQDLGVLRVPVSVCGELASDPRGVIVLLGMGATTFSTAVSAMGRTKWVLRSFTRDEAAALLSQALSQADARQVKTLLNAALETKGLGGLVRAGK